MSDKFKPGDKVRARICNMTGTVVGPHPKYDDCLVVLSNEHHETYKGIVESYLELIPEPRKIDGWLVGGDVGGISGFYTELHDARKAFETFGTYIFHVTGESVEERK